MKTCFRGDTLFEASLDRAFRSIINDSTLKSIDSSEILAKFCDSILKKGNNKSSSLDVETEARMNDAVSIKFVFVLKFIDFIV